MTEPRESIKVRFTGDMATPLAVCRGEDTSPLLTMTVAEATDLHAEIGEVMRYIYESDRQPQKVILGRTRPRR